MSKTKFTFRVEEDLLKEMKIFAIKSERPLNEILEDAFKDYKKNYINNLLAQRTKEIKELINNEE